MSIVLPFKLYSKVYYIFFQFHAQSLTKTHKQYSYKVKNKIQILFYFLRKVLYRLMKNIFVNADGAWAKTSFKNVSFI
jgi:hypothetical protein